MYPSAIEDYLAPTTLAEARAALSANPDAILIAGGQSLMQAIKARLMQPRILVDLGGIAELRGVSSGPAGLRIGGMTRYRAIHESTLLSGPYEALVDAASHVGDRQVRNRGTIGGSLCWNYIAACMPPTSIAVGAVMELTDRTGTVRTLPAEDFLKGPLETDLRPGEILSAVTLPPPPVRTGSAYRKWGLGTDALPIVGVGVLLTLDENGRCLRCRFAVGGLAAGPVRATGAEDALSGRDASEDDAIIAAARLAADWADPQSDHLVSAEYRKILISKIGEEVIRLAFARAGKAVR